MKKTLYFFLRFFARRVLNKYKPVIIGITGSVGKSSTKEAIYVALEDSINSRRSLKNYNNEIGVPLTILGRLSPGKNVVGWLRVFWMSIGSIIFPEKSYPKVLILEMAADRLGDIEYLVNMAPLDRGVITAISQAHTEFLGSLESISKEKQTLVTDLHPSGWAILNADDEMVMAMKEKISARIITFGLSAEADIQAIEISLDQESENDRVKIKGLRFKINHQGSIVPVFLPNIISVTQIYAILAAVATAVTFELNLIEIIEALKEYKPLPGRLVPIEGINNSLIIDDTYNSSPQAVQSALETLAKIKIHPEGAKKWVILGDMLELGYLTQEAHIEVGKRVAQMDFDYLITVGPGGQEIANSAKRSRMGKDNIFSFKNSKQALEFLKEKIKKGDVLLIKGSQSMRLEQIVKGIMSKPRRAKKLLVRQSEEWR